MFFATFWVDGEHKFAKAETLKQLDKEIAYIAENSIYAAYDVVYFQGNAINVIKNRRLQYCGRIV